MKEKHQKKKKAEAAPVWKGKWEKKSLLSSPREMVSNRAYNFTPAPPRSLSALLFAVEDSSYTFLHIADKYYPLSAALYCSLGSA